MAFPFVLDGHGVTAKDYQTILEDNVHLMFQTLNTEGVAMYQHDNATNTQRVTECFDEHESEVEHLLCHQSPDLNIFESLLEE